MGELTGLRYAEFRPPDDVRIFAIPPTGVLRRDADVLVLQIWGEERLVRHYAFADRWMSATVVLDDDAVPVPQPAASGDSFIVKCHVATPLRHAGDLHWQVDLWLDVLLAADGVTPIPEDDDEFEVARDAGLLSGYEAAQAIASRNAIADLMRSGGFLPTLHSLMPFDATIRPTADPAERASIARYPEIAASRT